MVMTCESVIGAYHETTYAVEVLLSAPHHTKSPHIIRHHITSHHITSHHITNST